MGLAFAQTGFLYPIFGSLQRITAAGGEATIDTEAESPNHRSVVDVRAVAVTPAGDLVIAGGRNGNLEQLLVHVQYGMLHYVGMEVLPPFVVYGHTPRPDIYKLKWSVGIDTGCAMGGQLTAYILPERRFVQVRARRRYYS